MSGSPVLRVLRGAPTTAELAAVTVVLVGLAAPCHIPGVGSRWADAAPTLRAAYRHGRGTWSGA